MQASKVNLKAKTKAQEWHYDDTEVEFGLDDDISGPTMTITPVEP